MVAVFLVATAFFLHSDNFWFLLLLTVRSMLRHSLALWLLLLFFFFVSDSFTHFERLLKLFKQNAVIRNPVLWQWEEFFLFLSAVNRLGAIFCWSCVPFQNGDDDYFDDRTFSSFVFAICHPMPEIWVNTDKTETFSRNVFDFLLIDDKSKGQNFCFVPMMRKICTITMKFSNHHDSICKFSISISILMLLTIDRK